MKKKSRRSVAVLAKKKAKPPLARRAAPQPEPTESRGTRARNILTGLKKLYPQADCALRHENPFQLLVATILSAQCTDETVNRVTPVLFAKYPTPAALAAADAADVERIIHSTGFFRQKTRSLLVASQTIVQEFGGRVPDTMEQLLTLPGVARKTANVVLGTAFGKNEGVVVDTHVGRLAIRLDLTWSTADPKNAVKIERDLMEVIPRDDWTYVSHALIHHGRKVCSARKPACATCTLAPHCPSAGKV